ncbi:MAG: histidinol-phosphatase HisJ family protein [Candidatus Hydrogenedens sp.]|nr:histidinol-phosphatase HisJ family protein [Candidatus Hydrogenedens sp.]
MSAAPWRVSCHGGHSSAYCDHAFSPLREMLDAAVERGFAAYGITEHAPRYGEEFLYEEEKAQGWTVDTLVEKFAQYAADSRAIQEEYRGKLKILRGFEAEVVPCDTYLELMQGLRAEHGFEYMVGSVHYVDGYVIDYTLDAFNEAAAAFGGVEPLAVRYYELVGEMVSRLRPEVVGHLDLIRKIAPDRAEVETPRVRKAALHTLEIILEHGGILDINTTPMRRGDSIPYVAPWLLDAAAAMSLPMTFGDDSHTTDDVGANIDDARAYLLEHGVEEVFIPGQAAGIPLR